MPKNQCAIVNAVEQIGDEYVRLSEAADWRTDKRLYNFIQTRRKNGGVRSKKFAATAGQLRNGGVYVHRDDVAAVVAEYRATVGAVPTPRPADVPEPAPAAELPPTGNLGAEAAVLAGAVASLVAAIADLTAAVGLAAEGLATPRRACRASVIDVPALAARLGVTNGTANGEG